MDPDPLAFWQATTRAGTRYLLLNRAQSSFWIVRGTITDASGAIVPGAYVTITEVNTNFGRSTVTNESGNYVFGNLDRGVYRVEVQLAGFKKAIRERADVLVNEDTRVDM